MEIESTDALIVVDVQNDFFHGGALPIHDARRIIRPINALLLRIEHHVFTRDWHPQDHCSFSDSPEFVDRSWPDHCVQNSPGAEFHGSLHVPIDAVIIDKGTDPNQEDYGAFENSNLTEILRGRGVKRIFVCGLATDYCVKATALGGVKACFEVVLIEDACQAVDLPPGSGEEAIEEMKAASIRVCQSADLLP